MTVVLNTCSCATMIIGDYMEYSFEELRDLATHFDIKRGNGRFVIVNKITRMEYSDPEFVSAVLFAHSWVRACQYNRQVGVVGGYAFTERDIEFAFSDDAERIYHYMMANNKRLMASGVRLYRPEALIHGLADHGIDTPYAADIIKGLYQSPNMIRFLSDYVKYATHNYEMMPSEPVAHRQAVMH